MTRFVMEWFAISGLPLSCCKCFLSAYWCRSFIFVHAGNAALITDINASPPHKIDENLWRNREQIEEITLLLKKDKWPASVSCCTTTCLFRLSCTMSCPICSIYNWAVLSIFNIACVAIFTWSSVPYENKQEFCYELVKFANVHLMWINFYFSYHVVPDKHIR